MLRPILAAGAAAALWIPAPCGAQTMSAVTADDVVVQGERYFGTLDEAAPLVLLFHQGGSNGRGEYAPLIPWLNAAGFRAIAWDQRSGGELHGSLNRTVAGLPAETPTGFCDAHRDLQAALDVVLTEGLAQKVVVWGSSYSGSLVFRLAAENPDVVAAVVSFSPASGGPMVECRARRWIDGVTAPTLALRPRSEMSRESSLDQQRTLTEAGVDFRIVENGVHGSSMLLDSRTEHDMGDTRDSVVAWLRRAVGDPGGQSTRRRD